MTLPEAGEWQWEVVSGDQIVQALGTLPVLPAPTPVPTGLISTLRVVCPSPHCWHWCCWSTRSGPGLGPREQPSAATDAVCRLGLAVTAAIVVLLVGATVAVYAIDPGLQQTARHCGRVGIGSVEGETVFLTKGCTGCHSRAGVSEGFIGPDLTALADRAGDRVVWSSAEGVRQAVGVGSARPMSSRL